VFVVKLSISAYIIVSVCDWIEKVHFMLLFFLRIVSRSALTITSANY